MKKIKRKIRDAFALEAERLSGYRPETRTPMTSDPVNQVRHRIYWQHLNTLKREYRKEQKAKKNNGGQPAGKVADGQTE